MLQKFNYCKNIEDTDSLTHTQCIDELRQFDEDRMKKQNKHTGQSTEAAVVSQDVSYPNQYRPLSPPPSPPSADECPPTVALADTAHVQPNATSLPPQAPQPGVDATNREQSSTKRISTKNSTRISTRASQR